MLQRTSPRTNEGRITSPNGLRQAPPATMAAAAAVLGTVIPEYRDNPQRLLDDLRLADQTRANQADAPSGPRLLPLAEIAKRLCVCRRTVQNWIASGELPSRKRGNRYVRVLESDLLAFIDNMPQRPVTRAETTAGGQA